MDYLPEYLPLQDAADWLSKKLGESLSAGYILELARSRMTKLEAKPGLEFNKNNRPDGLRMLKTSLLLGSADDYRIHRDNLAALEDSHKEKRALDKNDGKPTRNQHRRQEQEILNTLTALGYAPKALPPRDPGKGWVKAEVWRELGANKELFKSLRVFNHAWDRLRSYQEISEQKVGEK
jgi:hypothetical protein